MAVSASPLRAVLAAHWRATRNRLAREVGRQGVLVVVCVLVLLVITLVLPLLAIMLGAGLLLGAALPGPNAEAILGGLLTGLTLVGGAASGALGGAKQLTWESYRAYPVRLGTLLFAEMIAGQVDLVPMLLGGSLLSLCVGVGIAHPTLAPLLALTVAHSLATILLVQLLVGSLAERVVRRLRTGLAALGIALWIGTALGAMIPAELRAAGDDPLSSERIARLAPVGRALRAAAAVLPGTAVAHGLGAATDGRWGWAVAVHVYPACVAVALAFLVARLLEREAADPTQDEAFAAKLWSFRTPVRGVARLTFVTLLGSRIGRFGLVVPLLVVVLVKGPLAQASGRELWAVPGAYTYVSLVANQFQLNQFGLDGHGVKALLLLPVSERDVLRGKALGLAAYQSLQAALLTLLLAVLHRPGANQLAAGLLLFCALVFVQNAVGQRTSSWMPRMLPRGSVKGNATPLGLVLVGLALSTACGGGFGGVFALLAWRAPWALVPAMLALVTASALLWRALEPGGARRLRDGREKLLGALG